MPSIRAGALGTSIVSRSLTLVRSFNPSKQIRVEQRRGERGNEQTGSDEDTMHSSDSIVSVENSCLIDSQTVERFFVYVYCSTVQYNIVLNWPLSIPFEISLKQVNRAKYLRVRFPYKYLCEYIIIYVRDQLC